MPVKKLKDFLDQSHVRYVAISHSPAFTAQEIAASAHVPGREMAKTVMVKLDGEMALAVLPASSKVDLRLFEEAAGAERAELAGEGEFKNRFPDCEVGAMPPFGSLYGMRTYAAEELAEDAEIVFNAGSHTELLRLAYEDFERLEKPTIVRMAVAWSSW